MEQFDLFNDFDELLKIKPVFRKNQPYEVLQVRCGLNFELFLTNNGEVYSCGANKYGQLGTEKDSEDDEENEEEPGAQQHEENDKNQMDAELKKRIRGLGKQKDRNTVARIDAFVELKVKVKQVDTGSMHAVAVGDAGGASGVYAWGRNSHG